jgi:hypothetical protein
MSQITPGRHTATIQSANVTETKNGKAQVSFDLLLEGGCTFTGTKSLEGGAYEYTLNAIRGFGFNDDWMTLDAQLSGRECSITIEMEPGQKDPAKLFPKLQYIDPPRMANKPAAGNLLARLSAQAKGIARPADAPKPNPKVTPKPAPAPAAAPVADDECPY